ncbi:MAG TPA: DNA repair protein RecO [Paracoccaceae bacterium]|nr:DNA repair protein RecO [Paracoccaceae bacterium]
MEWQDEGMLIAARRHGESAAIIELFTAAHGRHVGVVPGGGSRRMAAMLQPGTQLAVRWRARLEDHIGTYRVEPIRIRAALILDDAEALAGLASACALLSWAMPERESHPALYARSVDLMDAFADGNWQARYALWELALLAELGFGLDLSQCALTGAREGLAYVSPRSGRAVSRGAAGDWAPRLFPLPGFLLRGEPDAAPGEIEAALHLTGHFLAGWLAPALERPGLPEARARLVARLSSRRSDRAEDEHR